MALFTFHDKTIIALPNYQSLYKLIISNEYCYVIYSRSLINTVVKISYNVILDLYLATLLPLYHTTLKIYNKICVK